MKPDITEIFCEIISGIAGVFVAVLLLISIDVITFEQVREIATSNGDVLDFAGLLLVLYLVGIVVDALGLFFDKVFGRWICDDEPGEKEEAVFWNKVSEHVLAYRNHVWAYYFCYRNLFMLCIPAGILWPFALRGTGVGLQWILIPMLFALLLVTVLFVAMRELFKLYYEIILRLGSDYSPGKDGGEIPTEQSSRCCPDQHPGTHPADPTAPQ